MPTQSRAKPLLIGELSDRTGVKIETIRYYEKIGLLPAPPRTQARHRAYDERHARRLAFVRRSRELGFSLGDVRMLLELADRGYLACGEAKEIAVQHLADIRGKIASLKKLERGLKSMTDACKPGRQRSCPIIETLSVSR
jgi:MerR family mercuric resistance operon transcriptional regulator